MTKDEKMTVETLGRSIAQQLHGMTVLRLDLEGIPGPVEFEIRITDTAPIKRAVAHWMANGVWVRSPNGAYGWIAPGRIRGIDVLGTDWDAKGEAGSFGPFTARIDLNPSASTPDWNGLWRCLDGGKCKPFDAPAYPRRGPQVPKCPTCGSKDIIKDVPKTNLSPLGGIEVEGTIR